MTRSETGVASREGQPDMLLWKLHPIREAIASRPGQVEWVLFDTGRKDRRINDLKTICRQAGVPLRYGGRAALDRLARGHQGAVARIAVRALLSEEEAFQGPRGERFLILLDEIQDPQNLGAAIRVAEGAGAGVVLPQRGSAPLSEAVARSSAGAVERVALFRAANVRRFVDRLKDEGFRVVGLDPGGEDLYRLDLTGDIALVLGAEGHGIRRLVREGCDLLARIPMKGSVGSLNVASAAAAAAYEVVRQRNYPKIGP